MVRSSSSPPSWPLAAATILAALVFLNSLGGTFVYDDTFEIRDNPDLRRPSFVLESFTGKPWGAERGYGYTYRPLSWSVATLLWLAGSGSPLPFHLSNLLLHALNTLLLGLLLRRLLGGAGGAHAPPRGVPEAAAFLFAIHPVHCEAVAWASGRSDLLATGLLMAAWLPYSGSKGSVRNAVLAALLLLAALFSKETAAAGLILMPASVAGIAFASGETLRSSLRRIPIRASLLQAAAFAVYLAARVAALGQIGRGTVRGSEMLNPLVGSGYVERILTSLALLAEHARLLFWPARLSIEYSFDQIPLAHSPFDTRILAVVAGMIVAGAALAILSPRGLRAAGLLSLLYGAAALPTSNLLPLPAGIFSERYLYLPSAIFCAGIAILLFGLIPEGRRGTAAALVAILVAAGGTRTIVRNTDWRDARSLYVSSAAAAPRAARLHYNLGVVYRDMGQPREAEAAFARALAIAPRYADARAERGVALVALGEDEAGVGELRQAAAEAPGDAVILNDLGGAYLSMGQAAEALPLLKKAVSLDPGNIDAISNLGTALASTGDLPGALEAFHEALRLAPDDDGAAFNLARALMAAGEPGAARPVLERLEERHPGDPDVSRMLEASRRGAAPAP